MKNNERKSIKLLIILMVFILMITNRPIYAANLSKQEKIEGSIEKISERLEEAIETSYSKAENFVKKECIKNGYDYYLTMKSFYIQESPYNSIDYLDIITAYLVAKQNVKTLEVTDFYSLPFINVKIESASLTEYELTKMQTYVEIEEGIYRKDKTIYIDTPKTVDVYEEISNGTYRIVEGKQESIRPAKATTKYGEVIITGLTAEDIFYIYGLNDNQEIQKEYEKKCVQLEHIINSQGLTESMLLNLDYHTVAPEMKAYIETLLENEEVSELRRHVISVASSLIGKVPYQWGGKASKPGYDTKWWSIGEDKKQKGLDCSGFVQWCYITAGFDKNTYEKLLSTSGMLDELEPIMKDELVPGDLGFLHNGKSESVNHVGIYVGEGKWIHCSSKAKTVTMEETEMFHVYKRMPFPSDNKDFKVTYEKYNDECIYSEEDIELVAKLIVNEANTQGINGWIAVAEVVKNRIEADIFPNSVEEVIYQSGQFTNNAAIKDRVPSKEQITVAREVLSGNMSMWNNPYVLYFRNANGSTEDWGEYSYFDTVVDHQFYIQVYKKGET